MTMDRVMTYVVTDEGTIREVNPPTISSEESTKTTNTGDGGIVGILVIDSTVAHSSGGGLRMGEDVNFEELRLLAKNMTLKYGFLGIPLGGAKAGILMNPECHLQERRERLSLFGRGLSALIKNRTYIPGPDIGTDTEDIRWVLNEAGVKRQRRMLTPGKSQYYTAIGVCESTRRGASAIGINLKGARVAIEGFGKVGSALAQLYDAHGALIIAVSTSRGALCNGNGLDVPRLIELFHRRGSAVTLDFPDGERIKNEQLLTLDMDILSPCARYHTITGKNAHEIKAKLISAGANVPVEQSAMDILRNKDVLVLPDFITNCGGVLGTFLELSGLSMEEVSSWIQKLLGPSVERILLDSFRKNVLPTLYATEIALKRFNDVKRSVEEKRMHGFAIHPSVVRFLRTILPSWFFSRFGVAYFKRSFDLAFAPFDDRTYT